MSQSVRAIAPTLAIVDGIPTTTSLEVAQHFGKRHDNVLQAIQSLRAQVGPDHALNFQEMVNEVQIGSGATRQHPAYRLTRDGFTLLAMGFTGKKALAFKLAYIEAFNRMEAELRQRPAQMPELDVRARLLGGQTMPPLEGYPRRVESAINREAWRMAQEAYELAREHLRRRVAHRHIHGRPAELHERAALADIRSVTLGQCLAQEALDWEAYALQGVELAQVSINNTVARLQQLAAQHRQTRPDAGRELEGGAS
jgi:Rha family phage regulatory protein